MERYIKTNNEVSHTFAADEQLNDIFGVGKWKVLPNPPSNIDYPEWDDAKKQWYNNDPRTYVEKRREAYPPCADQLDMIYHDFDNWKKTIKAIKDKYPKEGA